MTTSRRFTQPQEVTWTAIPARITDIRYGIPGGPFQPVEDSSDE